MTNPDKSTTLDDLTFEMDLPEGVEIVSLSSSDKEAHDLAVDGTIKWPTPLEGGESTSITLKLVAYECTSDLQLKGKFYEDNGSVFPSYVDVPLKNTVQVTGAGSGCSKPNFGSSYKNKTKPPSRSH